MPDTLQNRCPPRPPSSDQEPLGVLIMAVGDSPASSEALVRLLRALHTELPEARALSILIRTPDEPGTWPERVEEWTGWPTDHELPGEELRPGRARLLRAGWVLDPQGRPRPAEDGEPAALAATLSSVAQSFGTCSAAILLPGAGEEGPQGVHAVLSRGGLALIDPTGEEAERLLSALRRWIVELRPPAEPSHASLMTRVRDLDALLTASGVACVALDERLRLHNITPRAEALLGLHPDALGQPVEALLTGLRHPTLRADIAQVVADGEPLIREVQSHDGSRWYSLRIATYPSERQPRGAVLTLTDISGARRAQEWLAARARKQQIISALWRFALQNSEMNRALFHEAGSALARGVGATRTLILEVLPDDDGFRVQGSYGPGLPAPDTILPTLPANLASQVLLEQRLLAYEPGQPGPSVSALGATDEDARVAIPIPGPVAPWGVLCAFGPAECQFGEKASFLLTVANVLAETAERSRVRAQLEIQARRFELALRNSTTTVFEHDENLQLRWIYNPPSGRPVEDVLGKTNADIYEGPDVQRLMEMERSVLASGRSARDTFTMHIGTQDLHLDVTMDPLLDRSGRPVGLLGAAAEVTHQKRIEHELRELNRTLENRVEQRAGQVRKLATALTLAEQRERHRIAQVLHDHVQQLLYALQLRLRMLAPRLDPDERAPMEEALAQALHAIRSMSVELSPPVLKDEGLPEALRWLVLQIRLVHGLKVELDVSPPGLRLQRDVGMLLFHFVRELLFNVVKHAHTDHAWVHLTIEGEELVLTVADEGAGFDPGEVASHSGFGLYGIRERLALFDGRLEVESAPEQGSRIAMRIPLLRVQAP